MKPGPLLRFLLYTTAPIALAAPVLPLPEVPILAKKSLNNDALSIRDHQPPPPTATLEDTRTILPSANHSRIDLEEEAVLVVIDNRPLALSPAQLPASGVLSSSRPLTTEYLQALSRLQLEQAQAQAQAESEAEVQAQVQAKAEAEAEAQQQVVEGPELLVRRTMPVGSLVAPGASSVGGQDVMVQMNETQAAEPQQGSPCAGKHADLLVVGMVLTFLMVIMAVEMWTPASRFVRRALGYEGTIRLQEDSRMVGRQGLSFRDPDLEIAELADEKGGAERFVNGDEHDEDDEGSGAEPWALR